ncbi:MAG TPA: HEAT repeat domain-containing protein [Thermoanaerobaculia bacterium]|nr:HEAT repeat domain-containing protein [Thermoanaerobaculia bacterium]
MPQLLTESLDPAERERTHRHIEACAVCREEWDAFRNTWTLLGEVPEVPVPARVRAKFLSAIDPQAVEPRVLPFHRRPATRWLAQAAAVVVVAGGSYFAGNRTAPVRLAPTPPQVTSIQEVATPFSIAESHVVKAKALSPEIHGRPDIQNVAFVDPDPTDGQIGVSFDVTSRVTVTGSPTDKSIVRLLSYMLEDQESAAPWRSTAIGWVRQTYTNPKHADPEIVGALEKVLRNEDHEGVRINAIDTLRTLPPQMSTDSTRSALIDALRSDPNPAVRMKAVEALAKLASSGVTLDAATVDTLRQKASQDSENLYVRVKAAEALSNIRP